MRLPTANNTIYKLPEREAIRSYTLPLKNKRVKSLIDFYLTLVRKALQEIWEKTRIEKHTYTDKRGRRKTTVKIIIPKDKEFKRELREKHRVSSNDDKLWYQPFLK